MKLYLIRHGETDWNLTARLQGQTDIPLNDRGRELAETTGRGMAEIPVDLCISSPLQRAVETSKIILKHNRGYRERFEELSGLDQVFRDAKTLDPETPLLTDDRILEINFGEWEGLGCGLKNYELPLQNFDWYFNSPWRFTLPKGGEDIRDVVEREQSFLRDLESRTELQDKTILITTHGGAIRGLLYLLKGITRIEDMKDIRIPYNCEVSMAEKKDGEPWALSDERTVYYDKKLLRWR